MKPQVSCYRMTFQQFQHRTNSPLHHSKSKPIIRLKVSGPCSKKADTRTANRNLGNETRRAITYRHCLGPIALHLQITGLYNKCGSRKREGRNLHLCKCKIATERYKQIIACCFDTDEKEFKHTNAQLHGTTSTFSLCDVKYWNHNDLCKNIFVEHSSRFYAIA